MGSCFTKCYTEIYIHTYIIRRVAKFLENSSNKSNKIKSVPYAQRSPTRKCSLSPTLFLWYIDDIPTHPQTELALYADDALVRAADRRPAVAARRVPEHLGILVDYYTK